MTTTSPERARRRPLLSLLEALATPHAVDRYLELLDPMATARDMRARVVRVERPTSDSVVLDLRPTRQWRGFAAGQFVQLGVVIDGVRHTRCYSPTGAQGGARDSIRLIVRAHPGGLVSQYLVREAAVGMVLDLSTAAGEFTLPVAGSLRCCRCCAPSSTRGSPGLSRSCTTPARWTTFPSRASCGRSTGRTTT